MNPAPAETPEQWLTRQFEYEYCAEYHGDAEHHDVIPDFPFPKTYFAQCRFPPVENDTIHPTIITFRTALDPQYEPPSIE